VLENFVVLEAMKTTWGGLKVSINFHGNLTANNLKYFEKFWFYYDYNNFLHFNFTAISILGWFLFPSGFCLIQIMACFHVSIWIIMLISHIVLVKHLKKSLNNHFSNGFNLLVYKKSCLSFSVVSCGKTIKSRMKTSQWRTRLIAPFTQINWKKGHKVYVYTSKNPFCFFKHWKQGKHCFTYGHFAYCHFAYDYLPTMSICLLRFCLLVVASQTVRLCYVMLCYVMLCYVMLCYVMLCYVMLCYVMLCYVMLCYVMFCYVMIWYVRLG